MANRILKTLCFGLAIFLMIGCVPKYTWKADPVIQTIDNQSYTAQIKPVERYKGIFAGFKLTVDNKTGQDIEIDWKKPCTCKTTRQTVGLCLKESSMQTGTTQRHRMLFLQMTRSKRKFGPATLCIIPEV